MKGKISICHYKADSVLCSQGAPDADITFVIKGQLVVTQKTIEEDKDCAMFTAGPGEVRFGGR